MICTINPNLPLTKISQRSQLFIKDRITSQLEISLEKESLENQNSFKLVHTNDIY